MMCHESSNGLNICTLKKGILLVCCIFFLGKGQAFAQYEVSKPWKGILRNGVCWAEANVDKPGTLVNTTLSFGMLYRWSNQGWIATNNPFSGNDTISFVGNPCPAGWRIPMVEETKDMEATDGIGKSSPYGDDKHLGRHYIIYSKPREHLIFPVMGWFPLASAPISKYGYWTSSVDANDSSKAWMFTFVEDDFDPHSLLASRDDAYYIRCVKEKCDTIVVDTSVTIFAEELPYKWGDTTFLEGTQTGIYRLQHNNCAYVKIANLHLTVKESTKPCPGVLINGVCWAEYNVDEPGRFANPGKPYGMLYQWNRKKGWPAMYPDTVAGWDSSLEPGDVWEAANDPCPRGWRMPTVEELKTLLNGTKVSRIKTGHQDKVFGTRYTDIMTGNMVFFPMSCTRDEKGAVIGGFQSYYWSKTSYWSLFFGESVRQEPYVYGYSVRCVADENACDIVLTASERICQEDLPYTWHDTTFMEGTKTGEYRFQRTCKTTGCDSIVYLYLTVDTLCSKPCKEGGILINDVCWATSNVNQPNTFADAPEAFGMLYRWNLKKAFPLHGDFDPRDWYDKTTKNPRWEAINNPCPPGWRIPTIGETQSLLDELKVTREWTQQNGVDGMQFTDKTNGNIVFFPAAKMRISDVEMLEGVYDGGSYWSATNEFSLSASMFEFVDDTQIFVIQFLPKDNRIANSVRCVAGRDTTGCKTVITDTTVSICAKDLPYTWGGRTFDVGTESGVYRFQYISAVTGCDSIVNLHLTVNKCEKPCPGVLINGVCWAEYNVDEPGTFANPGKPYGMLYQWNRKKGWPAMYPNTVAGWDNSLEPGDVWERANDPCPTGWRMPTVEELKTLLDATRVNITKKTIHDNWIATKYTDIATGNAIFLPGVSYRENNGHVLGHQNAFFWSSSDYRMMWNNDFLARRHLADGYSVRCVADENACDIVLTVSERICQEDLPYTWHDTTFLEDTRTGEYRIRRTNPLSGCDSIFDLYLMVDTLCGKPCKEDGILINDICWAESNVDQPNTFADAPESFGRLYQWNRKKGLPLKGDIDLGDWEDSINDASWEAVNNPCPPNWRVPSMRELYALLDDLKVTREWTLHNGVDGMRFTDKANGHTVFLPAAGMRSSPDKFLTDRGNYWSSTLTYDENNHNCFALAFDFWRYDINTYRNYKTMAYSVRCVTDQNPTGCKTIITDTTVSICARDLPYTWDDKTFDIGTESGVYRFQYVSAVTGCDSIVNLHLNVHQPQALSFSGAVCYGNDYHGYGFNLLAVTADTIVSDTLQTQWGCDSIRTLFLSVHPVYNRIFHDTICEGDGYHGYGFHLPEGTTGGTFTETYSTVHGCDSTVTLHLYVSKTYLIPESQDICQGDTIDFRGKRLYANGVYDDTLRTVHDCDSIFRLTLTVHPTPDLSFSDRVCYGSDYHGYGFDLTAVTADTIVRDTLQTPWGCDSIRTLSLTVYPVYNRIFHDTICEGDGYHGYGFHLPEGTTGGTFTATYPSVHDCDSTVTLQLYVAPAYLFPESQDICQGDTIDFRGRRLYASGVYDDTLRTVHDCDSIYRLTLTVHPASDLSFSDRVCYGSDYHGYGFDLTAVTADTIVSDTLQTPWGCDSIRTLFLTVDPLYDIQLYDTICEGNPYTGYGFDVTAPGTHVRHLQSTHGCDSIVTLHLTVNPVYHHTVRDSVCPSERYDRHGFHLSDIRQSGTYRLPLQTVHGCDSTVTLELYVYHNYFYSLSQSICEGDTVDFRGRHLYESGIYYDSLRTIHQCDSIYSLDLTVHPVYDIQLTGVLCEGSPYTGYGFNVTEPGTHVRHLQSIHSCDSIVTLTLTEEKKVQGGIGFLLDDCGTHGYSFFLDPPHRMDTWQWDMGDGTVYRSEEGFHQYADSGVYRIQLFAETQSGCENRFSHVQQVPPYLPEVTIHADRQVIDEDLPTVRFRTEVLPDMKCLWDFGDGTTARGDSVTHTFDATTREYYDVTLRVLNADSCVTENSMRIEVVFLPKSVNTFTPNGDGVNDVFMAGFRIEVMDRNGLRIYTGDNGWDGTGKGGQAPQDTYFFRLYYRTANGERMKTGYVTLIR